MGSSNSHSANFNFNYDAITGNGSMVFGGGWDNIQYTIGESLIIVTIPDSFGTMEGLIIEQTSNAQGTINSYWLDKVINGRVVTLKFRTYTNPDPIRFIAIARARSEGYFVNLNVVSRLLRDTKASTPFNFNYVQSKALTAINSNVDQNGEISYGDKPVLIASEVGQGEGPLANFRLINLNGLSNDASFYRTDVNLTVAGSTLEAKQTPIIELTYDVSQCPNITSIVLQNGVLVVTANITIPKLFINQNINASALGIPGILQFNVVVNGNQAFITPMNGNFNELMGFSNDANILNFSFLIIPTM